MPTRRSNNDELHQHRYFSAVEFAEQRPLNGVLVCERASLAEGDQHRQLIWYLHNKSIDPGLPKFARDLVARFPERMGTPAMHRAKVKSSGQYDRSLEFEVRRELDSKPWNEDFTWLEQAELLANKHGGWPHEEDSRDDVELARDYVLKLGAKGCGESVSGEDLKQLCSAAAADLPKHLARICLDPSIKFENVGVPYFADLAGAILEQREQEAAGVRAAFALTTIGRIVWDELDRCADSGRTVLIVGETGVGKSEACKAWCRSHQGQAIRISLTPICNRTTFFQALASALGIASALTRTASKLELRVREVLQRCSLMVIIEEFHFAFPRCKRPTTPPEIPDWIYAALIEEGVAVAMIATPQVNTLVRDSEEKTGWNGRQWRRRVRRSVTLPTMPTRDDLNLVARALLPGASKATIKTVVGFAGRVTEQLDAIVDLVDEARTAASRAGRPTIMADDVFTAVKEVASSYKAKAPAPPSRNGRRKARPMIPDVEDQAEDDPGSATGGDDVAESTPRIRGTRAGATRENFGQVELVPQ